MLTLTFDFFQVFFFNFVLKKGNSAYGSQLLDRTKYTKTVYARGTVAARTAVNQPLFRHMTKLSSELYEVQSAHRVIPVDTPITVGLQILFEAKRVMLSWYYEFLVKYIPRDHFGTVLMDTGKTNNCSLSNFALVIANKWLLF